MRKKGQPMQISFVLLKNACVFFQLKTDQFVCCCVIRFPKQQKMQLPLQKTLNILKQSPYQPTQSTEITQSTGVNAKQLPSPTQQTRVKEEKPVDQQTK